MSKFIALCLLAFMGCGPAMAQNTDTTISLSLPYPDVLASVQQNADGTVTPLFTVPGINNIIGNYTFKMFRQAFPDSRLLATRQIYVAIASSTIVATDLHSAFPAIFPHFEITAPITELSYHPVDYGNTGLHSCPTCPWYDYPWYLDYIHAPDAWDTSIGGYMGDRHIVIGVTDQWFDATNPDLAFKVDAISPWRASGFDSSHGTQVAGLIAAATNNVDGSGTPIGYPAIGFNCHLRLSTDVSDDGMRTLSFHSGDTMSAPRILNGSWMYGGSQGHTHALVLDSFNFNHQRVYNEIYENGTTTCFAAGDGNRTADYAYEYCYPASLDHIISVTNVMGENCSWIGSSCATDCGCDAHNYDGDTVGSETHNNRVDICAPGKRTGTLDYKGALPSSDPEHYFSHDNNGGHGTSYCSPIVAGTLGLMLSSNPCLSPYQLEYALKMGSRNIYDSTDNAVYAGPTRWTGRLGAGALDAAGSVIGYGPSGPFQGVSTGVPGHLDCNDSATQTFFIDGIELKTICAPGHASNGVRPQLVSIIENGTPPYTYKWMPIAGNTTTLDDPTIANPTIVAADSPYLAYYSLTIYDNSTIQKVANRDIRIQLSTANTWRLAMRDSYVDMLDQPNSQGTVDNREWTNIFSSPDLWNRQHNDGDTIPEVAQYFMAGTANYMNVRVRNIGCADYAPGRISPPALRAYWTLASTGENWDADWTSILVPDSSGISMIPGGGEVTDIGGITIAALHPGESRIYPIAWHPIQPERYLDSPPSVDVCFLARIKGETFGFGEGTHISSNVRNNNNIVTRNTSVVDLGNKHPFNTHRVYVGNTTTGAQLFSLQMLTDKHIYKHFAGDLSEYIYIAVRMNDALFAAWSAAHPGAYTSLDVNTKTVTFDPATPLRIDSVTLDSGTLYYADITFYRRNTQPVLIPAHQKMHFQQLTTVNNTDEVYGRVTYTVNIQDTTAIDTAGAGLARNTAPVIPANPVINYYSLHPNPVTDVLNISWLGDKNALVNVTIADVLGKVVARNDALTIQSNMAAQVSMATLVPGIYFVHLQDANGFRKTYKISKLD